MTELRCSVSSGAQVFEGILMARVTVEDCLEQVENRFELVHVASLRTKMIYRGSQPLVGCDNREVVTSLREIADGCIDVKLADEAH